MGPTETSVQLQITAEDYSNVSSLTKGQLTMPEAMLLAKLTLCSHGNGSCWPPVRKEKTKEKGVFASNVKVGKIISAQSWLFRVELCHWVGGTQLHLGALAHVLFILCSCQATCHPAHRVAGSPLTTAELTSGQLPPTRWILLFWSTECLFCCCSPLCRNSGRRNRC